MAHHPNHKRNLVVAPDPQVSKPTTDLTGKRHPKKSSTTSAAAAAVYSFTNHFSRLHLSSKPTKPQNPPPQKVVDTHLQVKALSKSANFEPSAQKIGKQGKRVVFGSDKKSLVIVGERREKEAAPSAAKVKKVERELGKEERGNELIKSTRTIERVGFGGKIGRRRSFCDVQVELSNFLVTNCAKVVSADMPPFMQIHAVGFARKTKDSLEKFTSKSLALSLKKEFDGTYGPAWHCIVGTSFGSFVTHSVGGFLYFSMDQKVYVLLFKTAVQRLEQTQKLKELYEL